MGRLERLSWEVKLEKEGLPQVKYWEKRRVDSGYMRPLWAKSL